MSAKSVTSAPLWVRWPLLRPFLMLVVVVLALGAGRGLTVATAPPAPSSPVALAPMSASAPTIASATLPPSAAPSLTGIPPASQSAPTPTAIPMVITPLPVQSQIERPQPTGGTLRWRLDDEPQTLDPALADDPNSRAVVANLFDGLVQRDPQMAVRPALARSWSVSPDGTVYTFSLRPGLVFSNGDSLTAADVLYSWNRVAANTKAPQNALFAAIAGYDDLIARRSTTLRGLTAPDPLTVRVELAQPAAVWLTQASLPAFAVVDRAVIEKYGTGWTEAGALVGSGAFVLDVWRHDQTVQVVANPHYWEGQAGVDRVEMAIIKDDATARTRYDAGLLDALDLSPAQVVAARADAALRDQYHETPALRVTWLGFAMDRAPFADNLLLRRAIGQAIDRRALVAKALDGYALPVTTLLPPDLAGNSADPFPFDPIAARAALVNAGYATAADRTQLARAIGGYSYDATTLNQAVAEELRRQLHDNLGLDISLASSPSFEDFLTHRDLDHAYTFFRGVAVPDYPDPQAILSANFRTGVPANGGNYSAPAFDSAVARADSDPDPAVRTRNYTAAAQVLAENAIAIPLYADISAWLQKPALLHWSWTAAGPLPFKYAGLGK